MKKVLLTGMSGVGKSSAIRGLVVRGYPAFDADCGELSELVDAPDGELTGVGGGKDWVWREGRIRDLLSTEDVEVLFLGGCSPNQRKFYPQFDHIVLLTASPEIISERLRTRTNNPYGKREEEISRTLEIQSNIEPLLRKGAGHVIDTSISREEVIEEILRLTLRVSLR